MTEFYTKHALQGGYDDPAAPAVIRRKRRPGVTLTPEESRIALEWAIQKADEVAKETVGKRTCGKCHHVTPPTNSSRTWDVAKINLADRWMPNGIFVHAKHVQTDCDTCHLATGSKSPQDVLLPGIAVCRECHGGARAVDKVPSTCIACHDFHRTTLPPLRNAQRSGLDALPR